MIDDQQLRYGLRSLADRDSALYIDPRYLPRIVPWLAGLHRAAVRGRPPRTQVVLAAGYSMLGITLGLPLGESLAGLVAAVGDGGELRPFFARPLLVAVMRCRGRGVRVA
jgi:glycine/D-amino acid oxidase-like deaminating enzyme